MIFAQVGPGVLSIGLQHIFLLTLVNITHSARLIRVKPVCMVAQAQIGIGHYC